VVVGEALASIELMIQDESLGVIGADLMETKHLALSDDDRDRFLDGPTSRRIAIVDFDPASGAPLSAPAAFEPFTPTKPARGRYNTDGVPRDSAKFLAVNAFGTVFETVRMFEERAALGRQVVWAFDGDQLLVVPRAGQWANAFYERATRSLQFFWFDAANTRIYTALSRDIVAHECGHALLDSVVPSLYDALTPESIAIHEAAADLVAVLMALRSKPLRILVLKQSDNSITNATAFSSIAEQFGAARPTPEDPHPHALRDLLNHNTMSSVDHRRPHELSTVLSAIFYETLVDMFEAQKQRIVDSAASSPPPEIAHAANRALASSAIIFRRLLLRGIDYLPPGDLTFADVGRATLAADRAALPDAASPATAQGRKTFANRFVERGIVAAATDLDSTAPQELAIPPERLADVLVSDWEAYRFVEAHRDTLGIPPEVAFRVLPRVDATKEIGLRRPDQKRYATQRELILKVVWDAIEPNGVAGIPARQRRIPTGVTLALRWDDGSVLALVHSDATRAELRQERDAMLAKLLEDELLTITDPGIGTLRAGTAQGVDVRITGDVARVTGTQRLLHAVGDPT
jgi:hypothetical protein